MVYWSMDIPMTSTDGGRDRHERNDCVVRAIAVAFDMPYYQAHDLLRWHGRRDGGRTHQAEVLLFSVLGLEIAYVNLTLTAFIKANPTGTYLCHKRGHMFCVRDGRVFDSYPVGGRSRITYYAKVTVNPR